MSGEAVEHGEGRLQGSSLLASIHLHKIDLPTIINDIVTTKDAPITPGTHISSHQPCVFFYTSYYILFQHSWKGGSPESVFLHFLVGNGRHINVLFVSHHSQYGWVVTVRDPPGHQIGLLRLNKALLNFFTVANESAVAPRCAVGFTDKDLITGAKKALGRIQGLFQAVTTETFGHGYPQVAGHLILDDFVVEIVCQSRIWTKESYFLTVYQVHLRLTCKHMNEDKILLTEDTVDQFLGQEAGGNFIGKFSGAGSAIN